MLSELVAFASALPSASVMDSTVVSSALDPVDSPLMERPASVTVPFGPGYWPV
jgi:hypothetical protein